MGLVKHRPKIRLLIPRTLHAGSRIEAKVVLQAKREVSLDWLRAELVGNERATVGSGQYAATRRVELLRLRAQLAGRAKLRAGRSEFTVHFDLPPGLPPSYDGERAQISYVVTVRASIPWWPDARAAFELKVAPAPLSAPPRERPVLFSSRPEGPRGREPHVEGSLASSMVEAGGVVSGAVALANAQFNTYRAVDLVLTGEQRTKVGRKRATCEVARYQVKLGADSFAERDSVEYRYRLPPTVTPSFSGNLISLVWHLEVKAQIRWRSDLTLRVPLVVLPSVASGKAGKRSYRAPPVVGSDRMARLWGEVAAEHGLAYDEERGGLFGRVGQVELEVRREHRGRAGIFVVAELRYPSLALELQIAPLGLWGHLEQLNQHLNALVLGEWLGRRHHVLAREPAQVEQLVRALVPVMDGRALGPEHKRFEGPRINDERALLAFRDAGHRPTALGRFVATALSLASALDGADSDISLPAAMRPAEAGWRQLAARLGAKLRPGDCAALGGEVAGQAVEIRSEWHEGEPETTLVVVRPAMALAAERCLEVELDGAGPEREEALARTRDKLPEGPARELLGRVAEGAVWLAIASGAVELRLRGTPADPSLLVGRAGLMAQLCLALQGGGGPYR